MPAGIGVGSIDCVIPVWSAEVSSHSARGAFLALEFVMVSFFFSRLVVRCLVEFVPDEIRISPGWPWHTGSNTLRR